MFAAFCAFAAYVAFCEWMIGTSATADAARTWLAVACMFPFAGVSFLWFTVLYVGTPAHVRRMVMLPLIPIALGMSVLFFDYVQQGNCLVAGAFYSARSPFTAPLPYGLIPWLQTFLIAAPLFILGYHLATRRSQGARRQIWYLFIAYSGAFVISAVSGLGNALTDLRIPESNGATYLFLAGVLFVGIQRKSLLSLTPATAVETIIGSMEELLFLTDTDGRILAANQAALDGFAADQRQILHRRVQDLFGIEPEDSPDQGPDQPHTVVRHMPEQGRWLSFSRSPVRDQRGMRAGWVLLARDITVDKELERKRRESLQEKEVLLKEIHHRSKNTLQLILSLVSLRSSSVASESTRRVLDELKSRIYVVSRVYERVYEQAEPAALALDQLIPEIGAEVAALHPDEASRIHLTYRLDPVRVHTGVAIPVGLAIAELLSHVLVHASPPPHGGSVVVALTQNTAGAWHVRITDDGAGIPVEPDLATPGLSLAAALCSQVQARLGACEGPGGAWSLEGNATAAPVPDKPRWNPAFP
jgi:PAS domain S-box-containing protein